MKIMIKSSLLFACALFLTACGQKLTEGNSDGPPNVIVIFTDDQGYGDLACYGALKRSTPHIDKMASEGVRLTNFYVGQPVCSASRAALLTGCYSSRVQERTEKQIV